MCHGFCGVATVWLAVGTDVDVDVEVARDTSTARMVLWVVCAYFVREPTGF